MPSAVATMPSVSFTSRSNRTSGVGQRVEQGEVWSVPFTPGVGGPRSYAQAGPFRAFR